MKNKIYEDLELVCIECGEPFILYASKQRKIANEGKQNPKRCFGCLKKRWDKEKELEGYNNITKKCAECGQEFIFTAGEQKFYKEKGFENDPKFCKSCREERKKFFGNR